MPARTVLIGLAGAAFPALDTLLEDGVMPFLQEWQAAGVRAGLRFAPVSCVASWISLATGRAPAQHGISDLFRKQSSYGHRLQALASRDIGGDTLWAHLDREGRRATVLNFPLTFPPPKIEGHVVPGTWISQRQLRLGCHPSDLYSRFGKLDGVRLEELVTNWLPEDGTAGPARYAAWIQAQAGCDSRLFALLRFLMQQEPADLSVLLVRGFGAAQHAYLRFPDLRPACAAYFRALDKHLAGLAQSAGGAAHLVLVSEPSAAPAARTFFLNAWLAARGYLAWAGGAAPETWEGPALDTDQLTRQSKLYDWTLTRAWYPLAGGNGIFVVRRDDAHPAGVAEAEYESFRARLTRELAAVPDVLRVWKREDLFGGPHQELAPDLILEMRPGAAVSAFARPGVAPEEQAGAAAEPQGIFLAAGPAVRRGEILPPFSLLNVAPFLLYSLGLPVPADLPGKVPLEALDPAWLAGHPVETGSAAGGPAPAAKPLLNAAAEEEILQRLRSLGYLE